MSLGTPPSRPRCGDTSNAIFKTLLHIMEGAETRAVSEKCSGNGQFPSKLGYPSIQNQDRKISILNMNRYAHDFSPRPLAVGSERRLTHPHSSELGKDQSGNTYCMKPDINRSIQLLFQIIFQWCTPGCTHGAACLYTTSNGRRRKEGKKNPASRLRPVVLRTS